MSESTPKPASTPFEATLHERLKQSDLFRVYQDAFRTATGLPLRLVGANPDDWCLDDQAVNRSPFCEVLNLCRSACMACIETNRLQIHPQPIRWLHFIEGRISAFRVQHPSRSMTFDVSAPESVVVADPDRMRQVVDNLLSNALKYSPEGSDIDVRVALEDGHVATSVPDHGIGIPRDEIPQLFERFHRARNVSSRYSGGRGLGHYIAPANVEAHKGGITVECEEGLGSTFTIRLPLKD